MLSSNETFGSIPFVSPPWRGWEKFVMLSLSKHDIAVTLRQAQGDAKEKAP